VLEAVEVGAAEMRRRTGAFQPLDVRCERLEEGMGLASGQAGTEAEVRPPEPNDR